MFRFRQFSIEDDRSTMKVGTDGVLLGVLAQCRGTRILDLGTGSGLIALMLAQRFPTATAEAIDVDETSVLQARENFQRSPWGDRLTAIVTDARLYKPACSYDLVVSNPPFFAQSLKSPEARRTLARHNDTLSTAELLQCVSCWPKREDSGVCCLVNQQPCSLSKPPTFLSTPHASSMSPTQTINHLNALISSWLNPQPHSKPKKNTTTSSNLTAPVPHGTPKPPPTSTYRIYLILYS